MKRRSAPTFRIREEAMAKMCGTALRALGAAFIMGFFSLSGASAQTGNPIKVGMSLALTGAGAAPSKVISTALKSGATTSMPKAGCSADRSSSSFMTTRVRRPMFPASTPS